MKQAESTKKQQTVAKNVVPIVAGVVAFIGAVFLDASFNDAGSASNDGLFRGIGIAMWVIALLAFVWSIRNGGAEGISRFTGIGIALCGIGGLATVGLSDAFSGGYYLGPALTAVGALIWVLGSNRDKAASGVAEARS